MCDGKPQICLLIPLMSSYINCWGVKHSFTMVSLLLGLLALLVALTTAQKNITVQELDSSISYNTDVVDWGFPPNTSDSDGDPTGSSFVLTANSGAVATFTFTGTAVYYFAPLWPMRIFCRLSIDGGADEVVDLEDYSLPDSGKQTSDISEPTAVRWFKTGLENRTHEVLVKVGNWAVVEHFVYTTATSTSSLSTSSESTTGPTSSFATDQTSASSNEQPPSFNTSAIVGGVLGAVLGAIPCTLLVAFLLWRKRRMQTQKREWVGSTQIVTPFNVSGVVAEGSVSPWTTVSPTRSQKRDGAPPPYTI